MKRAICMILMAALLCGAACAMPVQLTNGSATFTASLYGGGEETVLSLDSFHLVGRNTDGSYLIYDGTSLYTVSADSMKKAVALTGEIPSVDDIQALSRGDRNDEVKRFQQQMVALKLLQSWPDGDYGAATEAAVSAFQEKTGLEATGKADEVTRLLIDSLSAETVQMEATVPPEIMFAPILNKTGVNLQPILEGGFILDYDDFTGEGFICASEAIIPDVSGDTDLDKYELSLRFGLEVTGTNTVSFAPAIRIRCVSARRPALTQVSIKAGETIGVFPIENLSVSLEGVCVAEEGVVHLDGATAKAVAAASDLKLRVEGQYKTFDVTVDDTSAANAICAIASDMAD